MKIQDLPETLRIPLERVLSVKRQSGSKGEAQLRAWLAVSYGATSIDEAGNVHIRRGDNPTTCFAAHTDTCHQADGVNKYREEKGIIYAESECLGADDGAGIAILCHMLSNDVPGLYIFTTGEEVGGVGARYLAEDSQYNVFEGIQRSVCFDRAGTSEIISVQGGERLASKEFAEALSEKFVAQDMLYSESTLGVFTDNALWGKLIPESVNLGVGYVKQHGPNEQLDLGHFALLADAAIKIDWGNLPTVRELTKKKPSSKYYGPVRDTKSELWEYAPYPMTTVLDLEDAVELAQLGNTNYLKTILTETLAEYAGVTFEECLKFVHVNKLKPAVLADLDWSQDFETLVDQMLSIAAPEIV